MNDRQIITFIKNRNEKGLSILYDIYAPVLNGIIISIVKSEVIAEEILQETFLKIWNNIGSYDEKKSSLFTWISRIARNTAIDHYRLSSFDIQRKLQPIDDNDVYKRSILLENTDKIDVTLILNHLELKYKVVLYTVYIEGYTQKEAAIKLKLPLGTVKTRIRIAIKKIREMMRNDEFYLLELLPLFSCIVVN